MKHPRPVHPKSLATVFALLLVSGTASAARRVDLHLEDVGRVRQARASLGASARGEREEALLARTLELDAESGLVVLDSVEVERTRNVRYQQTFRGIPIFGEHIIVSEDGQGAIRGLFGRKVVDLEKELPRSAPRLSAARALELAKEARLGLRAESRVVSQEHSRLRVFVDDDGRATRCYEVSFFADTVQGGAPTRPVVLVDADDGRILQQWENLQHLQVGTGPGGNTRTGLHEYGTNRGFLDVEQTGTTCRLRNARVWTVNLNGGTGTSNLPFSYPCPRNTVKTINGAASPLNDAHFFGGVVFDMYQTWLGLDPVIPPAILRVHYGVDYSNAYWDGTSVTMGDGSTNGALHPLVSLDILSHEMSHSFTERHSALTYSGQSAALHEAFSDMAGEAAKFFYRGSNDFQFGADVTKGSGAVRYLSNPPQDGSSIDHASNYRSALQPWHAAGVYDKAFYLLATTPGWDTRKAFEVFAHANALYWSPSTDFNGGACGVLAAARDRHYSTFDVASAFAEVGVRCGGVLETFRRTDASGKLTIAVFEGFSPTKASHQTDITVTVPADFVVIGGGGEGKESPLGNLLTASYPSPDLTAWRVSTKDHVMNDPALVRGWAIGLKVTGLSASELRAFLTLQSATSPSANWPDVTASLPPGIVLAGGGIRVDWTGEGNLAVASAPYLDNGWRVRSKDHYVFSPATATAYAIGIAQSIPGVGTLSNLVTQTVSPPGNHPQAEAHLPLDFVLSGCGAFVDWTGEGNLLWRIQPSYAGCFVASKDHLRGSSAVITAYALGLRVN